MGVLQARPHPCGQVLALPPGGGGRRFEAAVRERASMRPGLELIVLPLLEAWRAVRDRVVALDKAAVAAARRDERCRLLMTAPGVGAIHLIRHGQASWGADDYDELSDRGIRQSALLGMAWEASDWAPTAAVSPAFRA